MSIPEISTNGKPKKLKAHQVNEKLTSFSRTKVNHSRETILMKQFVLQSDPATSRCTDNLVQNSCFGEDEELWGYLFDSIFTSHGRRYKWSRDPEIAMQGELSCITIQAKHHENKQWDSE